VKTEALDNGSEQHRAFCDDLFWISGTTPGERVTFNLKRKSNETIGRYALALSMSCGVPFCRLHVVCKVVKRGNNSLTYAQTLQQVASWLQQQGVRLHSRQPFGSGATLAETTLAIFVLGTRLAALEILQCMLENEATSAAYFQGAIGTWYL